MDKDIFKDQKVLTLFIRQLCTLPDTPSLIQFVAGDEDYMRLCSRIVNAPAGDAKMRHQLSEIFRKHSLDFKVLKERLTPVGQALGLTLPTEQIDYYELLGVSSDARKADIKKAFRQKVRKVHPDTSGQIIDNGQDFINLKAAYQILSDPVLRRKHDEAIHDKNLWQERTDKSVIQEIPGRTKIFYQLGVLFLLMIMAVFIFDFLYRENSIFDDDYTVKQKQAQGHKPMKATAKAAYNSKTEKNSSEVNSLPDTNDNSRNISKHDDISQKATKEVDAILSADGLR